MSDAYRLTFRLPQSMLLLVHEGRHHPCLAGCVLRVARGLVTIEGPSRERLFDQARRFFRAHARNLPALQLACLLETPGRAGGADHWSVIVNSDVSFTPTTIEADIRPWLKLIAEEAAAV
jgi:hypothetical protein